MEGTHYEYHKAGMIADHYELDLTHVEANDLKKALQFYVKDTSLSYGKVREIVELAESISEVMVSEPIPVDVVEASI